MGYLVIYSLGALKSAHYFESHDSAVDFINDCIIFFLTSKLVHMAVSLILLYAETKKRQRNRNHCRHKQKPSEQI